MNAISAWSRRAQIPHLGGMGTCGTSMTFKGVFLAYTQALCDHTEMDIRVPSKVVPDFLFDLQGAGEAFEEMKRYRMGLSGKTAGRGQDQGTKLRL